MHTDIGSSGRKIGDGFVCRDVCLDSYLSKSLTPMWRQVLEIVANEQVFEGVDGSQGCDVYHRGDV